MKFIPRNVGVAAAVALAVAVPLCLGLTERRNVDAHALLEKVLEVEERTVPADVSCIYTLYGTQVRCRPEAAPLGSGFRFLGRDELVTIIRRNYTPLIEGEDTVAGRPVWTLRLKPARKMYPWKQLWVDKETFVVMASREWSAYNTLKSRSEARSADTIDRQAPTNPAFASRVQHPPAEDAARPRYLPHGFARADAVLEAGGVRWLYCDGLFVLTVVVGPQIEAPDDDQARVEDFGQGLVARARSGGRAIIVIGDLSEEEILRVARSVR